MPQIKSLTVTPVVTDKCQIRWCSRMRLDDGTELFAGLDNVHGMPVAYTAHRRSYAAYLYKGQHIDDVPCRGEWSALPEGWKVVA